MTVERSEDRNYPFTIKGGWGDKVYCTIDDLKDIKNQINKILKEEKEKRLDKTPIVSYNSIRKRGKENDKYSKRSIQNCIQ